MAIGPQDLLALTPEDEENIKKIESVLDEKLQANFEGAGEARLNISNAASSVKCRLTFKMRKELASRYEKVGWAIGEEAEPGKDIFFTFSVPGEKAPEGPVDPRDADVIPNMSTEEMLDKMGGAVAKPAGTVNPFRNAAPTSRGDFDDPYTRKKLQTRP